MFLLKNEKNILKKFIYKEPKNYYLIIIYEDIAHFSLCIGAWNMISYDSLEKISMKINLFDKWIGNKNFLANKMKKHI